MRIRRAAAAMIALTIVAVSAGCTDDATPPRPVPPSSAAGAADGGFVDMVAVVEPAVVTIHTDEGLGSGCHPPPRRVIVTNAHVVGQATAVQVSFADGTRSPVRTS